MTYRAFCVGGAGRQASHVAAPFIVPAISGRALRGVKAPYCSSMRDFAGAPHGRAVLHCL